MEVRTFGEFSREQRRRLNLTQEQVARRIGVSTPYIGHLELSRRRPSYHTVRLLAAALGVDQGKLLLTANPEAAQFLRPQSADRTSSALEEFCQSYQTDLDPQEMALLSEVASMGWVQSPNDFVYVLNSIRQILGRDLLDLVARHVDGSSTGVASITDALREEHKVFNVRFDELDQLVSRRANLAQLHANASLLAKGLLSHAHIENDILLPPLESFLGGTGLLATMKAEHQEIDGGLLEILACRMANAEIEDPEDVRDAVKGILQIGRQHLAMEDRMFRMFEKILGTGRLNQLGQEVAARRRAEPLECALGLVTFVPQIRR